MSGSVQGPMPLSSEMGMFGAPAGGTHGVESPRPHLETAPDGQQKKERSLCEAVPGLWDQSINKEGGGTGTVCGVFGDQ